MTDKDFYPCRFIREELCYLTYSDFCANRETFRHFYNLLGNNEKIFYKWYVYANIHMREVHKNAIWDYLNGYDEYGFELMRLSHSLKQKKGA